MNSTRRISVKTVLSLFGPGVVALSLFLLSFEVSLVSVASADQYAETMAPPPPSIEGLYMGHIYWVSKEQKAIVVTPFGKRGPRKRFYFDAKTKFLQGKVRLGLHELEPGDKVAIWYIGEGKVHLADKIYYVDGEFEPDSYLPKSRRVSPADQEIPSVKRKRDSSNPPVENAAAESGEKDGDQ